MSVHYRFKSALEYDTITFDGLHISVKDLKNAIVQQKRIGKSTDFDLQVTNAQTKEVYQDENTLIPKNTSLLIARIPMAVPKAKQWEGYGGNDTPPAKMDEGGAIAKAVDLSSLDAPEDDKIKAMMLQSTQDYDPSNYSKIRGSNQVGPVPTNYRCYKCHQGGHWIKDCSLGQGTDAIEIKKPTGIPVSLLVPVEGPQVQGAMMTPNGQYAVPALDHQAYTQKNPNPAPIHEQKPEIPEDLLCSICSDLMTDAVMIPCCGNSFCDECIRSVLLESDEHECPDCHEKDISPTTLIPNRFLRKSVSNFKNTTGYEKKYQSSAMPIKTHLDKKTPTPPPEVDTTEKELTKEEEKTVISEADSTEQAKSESEISKEVETEVKPKTEQILTEGPPGVSPGRKSPKSPRYQITSKINNSSRESKENLEKRRSSREGERERDARERSHKHYKHRPDSPRKHRSHHHSPKYESGTGEERQGTPTRDEPRIGNYASTSYNSNNMGPMMGNMQPGPMAGPIPNIPPPYNQIPPGFPPNQGPPPNFRLPPPGGPGVPPYMPPGPYPVPARPVFDPSRPPMSGAPPYNPPPNYAGPRPHRDYPGRRGRDRTPPGIIDDPLAAFNRILRMKDERRKRRRRGSWSRSRSRSPRSFSRSPPRNWSRSPRRRRSRSRSRSFSMSRSRSRSYHSPVGRGPPSPPYRGASPRRSPRLGARARYHSPPRQSPPRRRDFRDARDRYKDRRDDHREYDKDRAGPRDRYYDNFDDRRGRQQQQQQQPTQPNWQQGVNPRPQDYFPPPDGFQNRYPPRDFPLASQNVVIPRRFDDIAPPGVEEPPIPGLENEPPRNDKFEVKPTVSEDKEKRSRSRSSERKRRPEKRDKSRSPANWRNPSPKSKSRTPERSPGKHKKKRRESSSDREEDKRRSRDKKKHKDKRDKDKKKKDKRDKHRKSDKDKKPKEEFKQVIPKHEEDAEDKEKKLANEKEQERLKFAEEEARKLRRKEEEEREEKRLLEEKKKEERRLRFLEDERRIKEEAERKRREEEERKQREEEELRQKEEEEENAKLISLYDDDVSVVIEQMNVEADEEEIVREEMEEGELGEEEMHRVHLEEEEEESSVLEIHSSDMDLKDESDILAPLPEKSKWEVDGEDQAFTSPKNTEKADSKAQKVSNEVLKRAENAIFAKAINAIRPIEIKKVSADRAKLYSGERDVEKKERTLEITVPAAIEITKKIDLTVEKPRVSVKDRLGVKVDDTDRVVKVDRNRSRTISPFSRRRSDDEFRRHDRNRRSRSRRRERDRRDGKKDDKGRRNERHRSRSKHKDDKKDKRKRSPSRSESERRKKKDKKAKKEKAKTETEDKEETADDKLKAAAVKRKPTLDEANFEPDYDLELHTDDEQLKEKKLDVKKMEEEESSSSDSESSSSEEEHKKKKKHKKHKKKKRRESSSSSEESSEESSESDKDRKKKHKKSKKKKKKSKHK